MTDDTEIGGPSSRFPATRRSAILASCSALAEERRCAFDKIVAAYWKPVYKFIRVKWSLSNEDAKDLTQAFFTSAYDREFFKAYRPEKGSFRTFVRTCVTRFTINESKYASRIKRGGDEEMIPVEDAPEAVGDSTEQYFEREWVRNLFELAVEDLRSVCVSHDKNIHFALFERYDLNPTDLAYADLALEYGITVFDVTNYLAWCRREFRRAVMERVRDITIDDAEFRREARLILGSNG